MQTLRAVAKHLPADHASGKAWRIGLLSLHHRLRLMNLMQARRFQDLAMCSTVCMHSGRQLETGWVPHSASCAQTRHLTQPHRAPNLTGKGAVRATREMKGPSIQIVPARSVQLRGPWNSECHLATCPLKHTQQSRLAGAIS